MNIPEIRRKVFISYHHQNDQFYANYLRDFYGSSNALLDRSLNEEINSDDDDYVLERIRTEHLRDSTVTIVLLGAETWRRKWVDWEIYSSLRPYGSRTVNGLLGIMLPGFHMYPQRFHDNYKIFDSTLPIQTGYARLINWDLIWHPPQVKHDVLSYLQWNAALIQKRNTLMRWIDMAFHNREKTYLINNNRPRMK